MPIAGRWSEGQPPSLLVSAERANLSDSTHRAIVLDGPRITRLQVMAESLPKFTGAFVLRLDPADEYLLDVAAQQAGVSVRRLATLPSGTGMQAQVIRQERNFV